MSDSAENVVKDILVKMGQVFSRAGDAVFKDFTEACLGEGAKWADLKKQLDKDGVDAFEKFVNHVIKSLGYDISHCESGELYELVKSVILKSKKIGDTLKDLIEKVDGKTLDSLLCGDFGEIAKLVQKKGGDNGNPDGGKSKGLDLDAAGGQLKAIFDLVSETIDLIKKISDFEWEKLAKDCEDFGNFIKDKYFTEEFGRRILDYILILLLKNAKDVFADDVGYLIGVGEEKLKEVLASALGKEKAEEVVSEAKKYLEKIADIEGRIKELEESLSNKDNGGETPSTEGAVISSPATVSTKSLKSLKKSTKSVSALSSSTSEKMDNSVKKSEGVAIDNDDLATPETSSESKESGKKPSVQLQSALDYCKKQLNKYLEENIPSYNTLAKIFDRTYAILNLCGIIDKKSIDLVEIGVVKDANDEISGKTGVDLIDLASDKIGTTIEIPVIRWNYLEKMFTNPKDYLKEAFPLESAEDVEKLASKIATVIRSFNVDFPEFKNFKQFVLDIIYRIDDYLGSAVSNVKQALKNFRDFLVNLLKVIECYVVEFKNAIKDEFSAAGKKLNDLRTEIEKSFKDIKIENSVFVQKVFVDTFKTAAKKALVDNYAGKSVEDILHVDFDTFVSPINDCKNNLQALAGEILTSFKTKLDKNTWKNEFNELVVKLQDEFKEQIGGYELNADGLKKFACQSIANMVKDGVSNPLSDFDPSAYFKIIGDKVSDVFSFDFSGYLETFKAAVKSFCEDFCSALEKSVSGLSQVGDDIKKLATDIFTAWLENIKHEIYSFIIQPYAVKAVKNWGFAFVQCIINNKVKAAAVELIDVQNVNGVLGTSQKAINTAEKAVDAVLDLLTLAITLKDEAKNVKSLGDGIQFAIKLYKAIPDDVKNYVTELIDLPDISDIVDNIHLPEYTLDVENRFFAVTLWKYNYDGKGDVAQKANISIQLAVFAGEEDGEGDEKIEGLYILPVVKGDYDIKFSLGKNHLMKVGATASLNENTTQLSSDEHKDKAEKDKDADIKNKLSGTEVKDSKGNGDGKKKDKLGFFVSRGTKGHGLKIKPLVSEDARSFSAYLELGLERKKDKDGKPIPLTLVDSDVVNLKIGNYPQKIFIGYSDGSFDVGFFTSLEGLKLALKLKQLNGFFDAILSDDIVVDIGKVALSYSLEKGLRFEESAHVKIPFNSDIDLKFVKFKNLTMDLGLENGDLEASLLTTFIANLDCVAITFTDLGFGVKCNLFTPDCKAGTLKLEPEIKYPSGIGISIDASAVKGTGGIQWDKEKERFAGFLELSVLEKFGVNAMLVFTTGKGTVPFSFMGALSVDFDPGIQIGMGFSITSIGGSLGLNRGLDIDNLRAAVYDGSLSSVLFVKDIQKDFDKVLANIDKYYPVIEDQMYVGLLAKITWGSILSADFGLFVQAPSPVTIVVAGLIKVRLSESAEKYLAINANFLGGIQFDKGIFFDASLFDSKIVGIEIYGDMALRIYWGGDTKGFILSIGGFHPQYKPESGFNLVDMKRVGMKLDYKVVNMSLEAYFAITSNTVQFGAAFDMKIGWDKFGLTGNAAFNVLFQFKPFYFMADMSVGLAVKMGSVNLCSISLSFDLSGPAKWHAKGKAQICILFFDVSVKFNYTWGKAQAESDKKYIDVFPLFESAYNDDSNWKTISTDYSDGMVNLVGRKDNEFFVLPSDLLSFSQSVVPFNKDMNCYGEDEISDYSRLEFSEIQFGAKPLPKTTYELEKASFAPTLTQKMTNDDKLNAPSYEYENSGFKLKTDFGTDDHGFDCSGDIACDDFEDVSNVSSSDVEKLMDLWKARASAK